MARRIKPYNYSYRVALRFLKKHPKTELAVVYMWTIANLDSKHNFSKEGVRRAWNDFKKPKRYPKPNWSIPWGIPTFSSQYNRRPDLIIVDDLADQVDQTIFDKVIKRLLDEKKVEDHIYDAMIYGTSFMKIKL